MSHLPPCDHDECGVVECTKIDTAKMRELLAKSGAESWTLEQTWPGVPDHTIIRFAGDGLGFFQTRTEEQAALIVVAVNSLPALLDELDAEREAHLRTGRLTFALDKQLHAERERVRELDVAVELVTKHVGCGDNSCRFVRPTGAATNGGCRCEDRPFAMPALAALYKAALARKEHGR